MITTVHTWMPTSGHTSDTTPPACCCPGLDPTAAATASGRRLPFFTLITRRRPFCWPNVDSHRSRDKEIIKKGLILKNKGFLEGKKCLESCARFQDGVATDCI